MTVDADGGGGGKLGGTTGATSAGGTDTGDGAGGDGAGGDGGGGDGGGGNGGGGNGGGGNGGGGCACAPVEPSTGASPLLLASMLGMLAVARKRAKRGST